MFEFYFRKVVMFQLFDGLPLANKWRIYFLSNLGFAGRGGFGHGFA